MVPRPRDPRRHRRALQRSHDLPRQAPAHYERDAVQEGRDTGQQARGDPGDEPVELQGYPAVRRGLRQVRHGGQFTGDVLHGNRVHLETRQAVGQTARPGPR